MLATASCQLGFLDAAGLMGPLPGGSFYALLAEHGDRIVRDADFADCYSERMGRPSIPPSLLAKVLLLQYRCGLSDEQAMESVAWDLRWKVALGLPVDHRGWHPTTLTKYRARLLLHGKERLALENSLQLAGELGMLDAPAEQIVDSTPMLGAAATQDTVRLVRYGVRGLIDAVAAVDERAAQSLVDGLEFDYEKPAEKPDCCWRIKRERERMLTRVAQDAERALRAVEHAEGLSQDEAVAEAHRLLRELVGQDFEVDDDGVPRLHRGTRQGRIISTVDPEMRHGRKSESQRFDGFKLHVAATNSEQPLICAVDVGDASAHDGAQAKELIDQQSEGSRPERILGDSAYGDQQTREDMQQRRIDVLAHVPEGERSEERIGKREFQIDLDAATVTCPQGHVVAIPERARRGGERVVNFGAVRCNDCPLKPRCAPYAGGRKLTIARREDLLQAGRTALQDADTVEHLRRTRPRVERLIGLLTNRYGLRQNRYIGSAKGRLQANWAATLVNLNPIGHRLAARTA
jgi:transposase